MGWFAESAVPLSLNFESLKNWPTNGSPSFRPVLRQGDGHSRRGPVLEKSAVDLHVAIKVCSVAATMELSGCTASAVSFGSQGLRAIAPGIDADSSSTHSFAST